MRLGVAIRIGSRSGRVFQVKLTSLAGGEQCDKKSGAYDRNYLPGRLLVPNCSTVREADEAATPGASADASADL